MAERREGETPRETGSVRTQVTQDRFEVPPKGHRVGAHRMVMRPRRFWYYAVAALVGVALVTGVGVVLVQTAPNVTEIFDRGEVAPVAQRVEPKLDPEATVAVLNGTEIDGLQDEVATAITDGKWGVIGFSDVAAANDVQISAVFYASADDEPAALALSQKLGGVSTYRSQDYVQYDVQLAVLLGADYAGPGSAAAPTSSE